MIKATLTTCVLLSTLFSSLSADSPPQPTSAKVSTRTLEWLDKYEVASQQAKATGKPLFIYFTGSDWCGWCKKMDKEILSTEEFIRLVGDTFIFVKIDFPIYSSLDKAIVAQNEELKEKFEVTAFPTIIITSSEGKQIAVLNYKPGGGKSYAEYLLKLLQRQQELKNGMKSLPEKSIAELQALYERATELGMDSEGAEIVHAALQKEDSPFFLTERYRLLLNEGLANNPEAENIKKKLLIKDPENKSGIHYSLAVIDFEARAENLPNQLTADQAVQPLQQYLRNFGAYDSQNRWKIELTISQVFRSKNQHSEALSFAKEALCHAPEEMKNNVAQTIVGLEDTISAIGSADK